MIFEGVHGKVSTVELRQEGEYLELYLNQIRVPGVISCNLVLGSEVPKVVLEVAVKEYQGPTKIRPE